MIKKIQFGLPTGAGGLAAATHSKQIKYELNQWAEKYKRTIIYNITTVNDRPYLTVEFQQQKDLTLFALNWQMKTFMHWQISPE
jgi:hypothetical protein